jgi:hypothetical protein
LPSKYSSTHLYLFTGRAFPLLVCWSSDGDLNIFSSSQSSIQCCGLNTVLSKLCTASSRSSQVPRATQSMRRKYCRCTSSYLHRPSFQYAASAAGAASSTCCLFLFFITPAQLYIPHGAGIRASFGTRAASAELNLSSFPILFAQCCLSAILPHSYGLLSNSAISVVPVANVLACRHSFPPAKRRAGSSSIPTSLSPFNRVSLQHTDRLGQLSASPDPTPPLASSCFSWLLSVAACHLPKSPCRMRHMEPTRRVAVDSLIPSVPLAANPRIGSACACCRAY